MPDLKFKFLNEAEIKRKILAFPDKIQKQVLRSGVSAACRDLRTALKSATPAKTGNLREHWKISVRIRKGMIRGRVSNRARHSWLVEFGSGPRYQKKTGKYVGQMPPNPFGRSTFEANTQRYIETVSRGIRNYMSRKGLL